MRISTAQQFVVNTALKRLHIPIMLNGPMGIGKTWAVHDSVKIINDGYEVKDPYKFIDLRLATQEPGDLIGLPRTENGRTIWTKPDWWPEDGTNGILFLDELNRAPIDVRQAVFQLVSEWRMHTHVLPKGWSIVAAINPDNGEYQVETLDKAMYRRFVQIKVLPDTKDWCHWADDYGIDKRIIKFIRENTQFLYKEEKIDITAYPTPEGYRMVDEIISNEIIPKDSAGENNRLEVIAGLVGVEAAAELVLYLNKEVESCISAEEVLNNYPIIKNEVHKQPHDRMYKTVYELILMFDKAKIPSATQLPNLMQFIKDLGAEWKTTFLTGIVANKELIYKLGADRDLKRQLIGIKKTIES